MEYWTHILHVFALVAAVNAAVWVVAMLLIRRKARLQAGQYGTVDPALADGRPFLVLDRAYYVATLIDGGRYFARGYWARGNGRAVLTADALIMHRWGVSRPVVIPRKMIMGVERHSSFAGKWMIRPICTVVKWRMGGGRFESGFVLGRDDAVRKKWDAVLGSGTSRTV